jgi:hypothetical protein
MSHHGWVQGCTKDEARRGERSPFGRLLQSEQHAYEPHALSLLAGALGPLQSQGAPDERGLRAGFTFLGQFIDHDLTEFRVVRDGALVEENPGLGQRQRVLQDGDPTTTNGRTSVLDLDAVYGLLGERENRLFDGDRFHLREEEVDGTTVFDIQRNVDFRDGRLIADPRNDENKIVVQVHLLFMRLHNQLVNAGHGFDEARRRVQTAYRRIVLHDYLPRIARADVIERVLERMKTNDTYYQRMNRSVAQALRCDSEEAPAAMPVEFAHAAFRLGHAQLLNGYELRKGAAFPLFITQPRCAEEFPNANRDLRGNEALEAETTIEWAGFFGPSGTRSSALDLHLAPAIFRLPRPTVTEPPISLAERNIRRGVDFGLPSGQEAAIAYKRLYGDDSELVPAARLFPRCDFGSEGGFRGILDIEPSLATVTPLWYYVLAESDHAGERQLGWLGSYIVAETLLGALEASDGFSVEVEIDNDPPADRDALRGVDQDDEIRTMTDLLVFLGELQPT